MKRPRLLIRRANPPCGFGLTRVCLPPNVPSRNNGSSTCNNGLLGDEWVPWVERLSHPASVQNPSSPNPKEKKEAWATAAPLARYIAHAADPGERGAFIAAFEVVTTD